jgi:adenylate cyclase
MRDYLVDWNKMLRADAERLGKSSVPIHLGIGLNTGECCVGNVGSEQRFDYSVLGDEVNLASRLEGQSKIYGVDIIIGEQTQAQVGDAASLELDLVRVKGKTKPVRIHALLGSSTLKSTPEFQEFHQKHQALLAAIRSQRWEEAQRLIEECLTFDTPRLRLRALYALYRGRVTAYQQQPPGEGWDGVFVALSK